MRAPDLYCPCCEQHRAPELLEADGVCSLCKIVLDAEMSALADARRDETIAHQEDTATVARAYGPRTGHDFAPPAVPLTCGCGQLAVVQRGDLALCGDHLNTAAPPGRTAA